MNTNSINWIDNFDDDDDDDDDNDVMVWMAV